MLAMPGERGWRAFMLTRLRDVEAIDQRTTVESPTWRRCLRFDMDVWRAETTDATPSVLGSNPRGPTTFSNRESQNPLA